MILRAAARTLRTCCAGLLLTSVCAATIAQTPAALPAAPAKAGAAPRLKLATSEWNFGRIWWGDPCATEIEVRNEGDAPLEIRNVRTSCGCTGARPGKSTLAPGESDKIKLSYDSKKGVETVSQTATVETNDPTNPNATIQIKGEIRNLFQGKPSQSIMFGTLTPETQAAQAITLTNNVERPIHLKLKEMPADCPYDIRLEEVSPGKEYRLSAATRVPMQAGGRFAEAILLTGIADRPEMKISVNAYVQERVTVQPTQILAMASPSGPVPARDIRLSYMKSIPLTIREIRSSHPDLIKAAVIPPAPGSLQEMGQFAFHVIRVEMPEFSRIPDAGVSIEIATDDAEQRFQRFTIPITKQSPPPAQPQPTTVSPQPVRPPTPITAPPKPGS